MELDYNFYALFETVGFIQAITLGSLLMLLHKKEYKSSLFLGLFLVLFALETIPIILESLNAYEVFHELYLLPFDFFWLHFPVFLIYTQQVGFFRRHEIKYWVLIPGGIAFCAQLFAFFLPYETKLSITENAGYDLYNYVKIIFGLGIGFYTLLLLKRHKVKVHNYFSMVENKELAWARWFLIYNLVGFILYLIIAYAIPDSMFAKIFFLVFDLILIYWVSYHGVKQRNVISLLTKFDAYTNSKKEDNEAMNSAVANDQDVAETMIDIDTLMEQSEIFVDSELTLIDLAEKLNTHPKRISTVINTSKKQNFNSYVNHYRIKKAEKLLKSTEMENLSIEGIGAEVGFHSKSAFYSSFKKVTGTTPLKFKQKNNR